jgi:hypothetical protein
VCVCMRALLARMICLLSLETVNIYIYIYIYIYIFWSGDMLLISSILLKKVNLEGEHLLDTILLG